MRSVAVGNFKVSTDHTSIYTFQLFIWRISENMNCQTIQRKGKRLMLI